MTDTDTPASPASVGVKRDVLVHYLLDARRAQRAAEERARKQADGWMLLVQRLVLTMMLSLRTIYPTLVRLRLALSRRFVQRTYPLSLLVVRQLYGDHNPFTDHYFLSGRRHPTFQGAACAVS